MPKRSNGDPNAAAAAVIGRIDRRALLRVAGAAGALASVSTRGSTQTREQTMPANNLPDVLETAEAERLATGFIFAEGPLWHPDGYWYFVDLRRNQLLRMTPGKLPEVVRTTEGGNGTTFDLKGRLILCEGDGRKVTRMDADGKVEPLAETYKGGRLNRPNDVVCHSNGSLYFTDPDKRRAYHEREIPGPAGDDDLWDGARVYRVAPDGSISVLALCEYPNGLALSVDERTMYVANTRSSKYIHAIRLDADGKAVGRSIFADMNEGSEPGIPDGLKVDSIGRVYCTGPGGIWVFAPDGKRIGIIRWPEQAVNFAFGGPDLRTMFCCAYTSVYTLRMKVPGNPHPWYKLRGR
jgi:gluconolactonase